MSCGLPEDESVLVLNSELYAAAAEKAHVHRWPDGECSRAAVRRLDRYRLAVDSIVVRADSFSEARIRALDSEARARFVRIMSGGDDREVSHRPRMERQ